MNNCVATAIGVRMCYFSCHSGVWMVILCWDNVLKSVWQEKLHAAFTGTVCVNDSTNSQNSVKRSQVSSVSFCWSSALCLLIVIDWTTRFSFHTESVLRGLNVYALFLCVRSWLYESLRVTNNQQYYQVGKYWRQRGQLFKMLLNQEIPQTLCEGEGHCKA